MIKPLTIHDQPIFTLGYFTGPVKICENSSSPLKKRDNLFVHNYRTISLLQSLSKLFERKRLCIFSSQSTCQNKTFYECQFGLGEHQSTKLATLELMDRLLSTFTAIKFYGSLQNLRYVKSRNISRKIAILSYKWYSFTLVFELSYKQKLKCGIEWHTIYHINAQSRCTTKIYPGSTSFYDILTTWPMQAMP